MAYICDLGTPPEECHALTAYLEDFVEAIALIDNFRYGEGLVAVLSELWAPCDPPDCAVVIWYSPGTDEFTTWSFIAGTWRQTGLKVGLITPYYTSFEGDYGALEEGWISDWVIDGAGNVLPIITLSGTELVLNPDLEDWTAGNPDDWGGLGIITEETIIVNEGSSAAKIVSNPKGRLQQSIVVTEGRWFVESGYGWKPTVVLPDTIVMWLQPDSTWFPPFAYVSSENAYEKVAVATFSLTVNATIRIEFDVTALTTVYVDTFSMQEITAGWNTLKEFYSKAGTFYVDITLGAGHTFGLVLNYQDEDNHTMVLVDDTDTLSLIETVAGVATITNSWVIVYTPGARLEVLRDSSDDVTIDYNSLSVVVAQALASPNTATEHGMVGLTHLSSASAFGYTPE